MSDPIKHAATREMLAKRYVTESKRPTFVAFGDRFTVDFSATDQGRPNEAPSFCSPILDNGRVVLYLDREIGGVVPYALLLEQALMVAAEEIAALRRQLAKK